MNIASSFDLSGKSAIVTGSSKGIGRAIARALGQQGASVVVSSRKQEACDEVVKEFESEGIRALGVACHMGSTDQIQSLVDQTIVEFGSIDVLVNNAATNPIFGSLEDADGGAFDKIMSVNVKGPWELAKYAFDHLKAVNGSVINISSIEGLSPGFGLGLYSVSKSALIALTKTMAREWGKNGIRANVICPGLVETKFSEALTSNPQILDHVMGKQALQTLAQPVDMAGMAVYLASPAASFITGGVFTADGGYTI
ncbi:MAG: glucose 1-dehydrogenase [Bacteroidota bacterium]